MPCCVASRLQIAQGFAYQDVHHQLEYYAGKAHVCGFEQERIPDLALLMQAGFKARLSSP